MVIDELITTGILVQFVAQIRAVSSLRRNEPDMSRPYRVWLYPLLDPFALAGWIIRVRHYRLAHYSFRHGNARGRPWCASSSGRGTLGNGHSPANCKVDCDDKNERSVVGRGKCSEI